MAGQRDGREIARRIGGRIDEIYARGTVLGDDGQLHEIGLTSVNRHRGAFIADLVRSEQPHATLEIGMAWGLSTLFILKALLENGDEFRPHVVVDPFQSSNYYNSARRVLRDLGIEGLVQFHDGPSELVLPMLVREKQSFDLAFIDGDHRFESAFVDLRFVDLLLKPGAVVIFDDADWPGVELVCRFARTNYGYQMLGQTSAAPRPGANHDGLSCGARAQAQISAYRKPLRETYRPQHHFIPFFEDFDLPSYAESILQVPSRHLRHEGHMLLRSGNTLLARLYFKVALCGDPSHFKTYLRLLRTYLPDGVARVLAGRSKRAPRHTRESATEQT